MMPLPRDEQAFLDAIKAPPHAEVHEAAEKFLGLTGMSVRDLGDLVRREHIRCGHSTLHFWFRNEYGVANGAHDGRHMDARIWDTIQRHWPKPRKIEAPQSILRTRFYEDVRVFFEDALACGANAVIAGPPSSEKSEVLQYLVGQRQATGHDDAVYIKCDPTLSSPLPFLRRLCREAGVHVCRTVAPDDFLMGIVDNFRRRAVLPALVFDEAQDLPDKVINTLRGVQEHTRRRSAGHNGAAFLLAGSHDLMARFENPSRRQRIEQVASRVANKYQSTGMTESEFFELAARAFGDGRRAAKLSDAQEKTLRDDCIVKDPYTHVCAKCFVVWKHGAEVCGGCGGAKSQPLTYLSPRRALEIIRQSRKANPSRVSTPDIQEVA